jgi:hypothetical protein
MKLRRVPVTPVAGYGQAIRHDLADEVYWFHWNSTENGCAVIRVAPLGSEAIVFQTYRPSHFGKVRRFHGQVSRDAWARLEDALVEANFWMLDNHGGRHGLDGSIWSLAGRRHRDYHFISRWSPDDELWDLGRLFFDLAALDRVRLY